jgi:hypothetical protein
MLISPVLMIMRSAGCRSAHRRLNRRPVAARQAAGVAAIGADAAVQALTMKTGAEAGIASDCAGGVVSADQWWASVCLGPCYACYTTGRHGGARSVPQLGSW